MIGGTPQSDDEVLERLVLVAVLEHHPAQLTFEELMRELGEDLKGFSDEDSVRRAIRELKKCQLLREGDEGTVLVATAPLLRVNDLWDGLWAIF